MKIEKLNKNDIDLEQYKNQHNVRRSCEVTGGFEKIVYATDTDVD